MVRRASQDPGSRALAHLADLASRETQLRIVTKTQSDLAFMWGAGAVHPMQALETEYREIVHEAESAQADPAKKREAGSRALEKFFFFEADQPHLLGVARGDMFAGERFPLPNEAMREAKREWRSAASALQSLNGDPDFVANKILDARRAAWRLSESFVVEPHASKKSGSIIAASSVRRARALISAPATPPIMLARLRSGLKLLEGALEGDASVQMFYIIEPFYLFRLLVGFRIDSSDPLTNEHVREASGALTELLNSQQWLADWLARVIVELGKEVEAVDPHGNVRFFLKGGRAMHYLFGTPKDGKNDWDTQILINPDLPAKEWYELFRKVSNTLLVALMRYKAQFYSLLQLNAGKLEKTSLPEGAPADPHGDIEPPWFDVPEIPALPPDFIPAEHRGCKAELIDVGIPRRGTIEAREQWVELRNNVIPRDNGMPVPGYAYYIDEYLTMIREFFDAPSQFAGKITKRIDRLAALFSRSGAAQVIMQAQEDTPPGIRNIVSRPITEFASAYPLDAQTPLKFALIELVGQFAQSYDMGIEPDFGEQFGQYFVSAMLDAGQFTRFSGLIPAGCDADAKPMAEAIGFGHLLARQMTAHLAGRAELLAAQQGAIDTLIRTVYENSVFEPSSELEVQFALSGSRAAALHAEYLEVPTTGLEPVWKQRVGLYFTSHHADPATVIELIEPLFGESTPLFTVQRSGSDRLLLFWKGDKTIDPLLPYKPLAIEFVARRVPAKRQLSYIWGLPVLGLRDLIEEYRQDAARTREFAMRNRLRSTADALTAMLMQARD